MNKISATLLEFAQPVIETLPPNATLEMRRLALQIAATVWNAIVIEAWGGEGREIGPRTLSELKQKIAGMPEPISTTMGPIIELLAETKRTRYAQDVRGIGNWELRTKSNGELSVWAEAHAPSHVKFQ